MLSGTNLTQILHELLCIKMYPDLREAESRRMVKGT